MKKILFCFILILFSIINVQNVTAASTGDTIYLNSTFYNYDGEKYFSDIQKIPNIDYSDVIFFTFGSGLKLDGQSIHSLNRVNQYIMGSPLVFGMVKEELVNKNISFNYKEGGIYDESTSNKSIYTNVGIPMTKGADGWWDIDSKKYDIYFSNSEARNDTNLLFETRQKCVMFTKDHYDPTSTKVPLCGFFPLNNYVASAPYEDGVYHFGIRYDFPIVLPSKQNNGKDIVHKFYGDDDIWIYLDGKLVLDMGGLKDPTLGTINFTTGEVLIHENINETSKILYQGSLSDVLGEDWNERNTYELSLFYLERGMGGSNLKINFNIPDESFENKIIVKHVDINTKQDLIAPEEVNGLYGNFYQTSPKEELLKNYKLVKTEGEENGRFDIKTKTITYYYNNQTSLLLKKVDEDSHPLEGAEFSLYEDEDLTKLYKQGVTTLNKKDSIILFDELIMGKTYYLKETKAPTGYRLLEDVIPITINEEIIPMIRGKEAMKDSNGNYYITLENIYEKSFSLPMTGGLGRIFFTLIGGSFITMAIILLLLNIKRRNYRRLKYILIKNKR